MSDHDHDYHEDIEGYCMRCRESVIIEAPKPVWTRKGQAATRGECPMCGGTVFRMGKTDLHNEANRPEAIQIGDDDGKRNRPKLARDTVYVNFAVADEAEAQAIAADLEKSGMAIWLHDADDQTSWSGGMHPALKECSRMVVVLSGNSDDESVVNAWQFFRDERKPIVLAQIAPTEAPDALRRSPRFDFADDFKRALRQMLGALSS
jgi:DNA-directed RNA polymerase subunit RPC12/RpoP